MALLKKQIQTHHDAAYKIAVAEYVRLVREALHRHPKLKEFINGMGSCFFIDRDNGDQIYPCDREYLKPIDNFLAEWDGVMKLTGDSMRFTATGRIARDW
jgi:hypothetical protein